MVDVTSFGAIGDGRTDDTAALQTAITSLRSGQALRLPADKVFVHSDVLHMTTAGTWLVGPGTLLATNEEKSALRIEADDVVVDGVSLKISSTSRRWSTPDQHRLFLGGHARNKVRNVSISGSAAAGLFCLGATDFVLDRVQVSDTRADGIHMTDGSSNGQVISPVVTRSGDDGVAVVSYYDDAKPCSAIVVTGPTVRTTTGGRGISVVGGQNITYRNIDVSNSNAAAVYIACEGGDSVTRSVQNAQVIGGRISGANTNSRIDHGAVLVYSGRSDGDVTDALVSQLTITDTRKTASRQIGVVRQGSGGVSRIRFENITLDATPRPYQGNTPSTMFSLSNVTAAGNEVTVK